MMAADSVAFPEANRVLRLGTAEWSRDDDDILQELSNVIGNRVRFRRHPAHVADLLLPPPRIFTSCGESQCHVYLLYGERPIFVDGRNQIQYDMRGLIFELAVSWCSSEWWLLSSGSLSFCAQKLLLKYNQHYMVLQVSLQFKLYSMYPRFVLLLLILKD